MIDFTHVSKIITEAGKLALKEQNYIRFNERQYKKDGSVLTRTDKMVENFIYKLLIKKYPNTNFITEESEHSFDENKEYTFVLDPIDGSDSFSQRMHGWSLSLAVLNKNLQPVGGIVYSPKLDLLFSSDINKQTTFNGKSIEHPEQFEEFTGNSILMIHSHLFRELDMHSFPGKVRSIGSAALHLCFPIIYPGVIGSLQSQSLCIWDIAGAHAINRAIGFEFQYLNGSKIDYSKLIHGERLEDFILSGSKKAIEQLRKYIIRIENP